MKVLLAGASGAIGQPLLNCLVHIGHEVYGITHSEERAQIIASKGARPLHFDVLDPKAVSSAIEQVRPDVIIDMLTSLPKEYTPEAMRNAAARDAQIRLEGGKNLLQAAIKFDARRYIIQSTAFWYAPGVGLADETTPFASDATPGIAAGVKVYTELEKRVLQSEKIEGVALRFGFYYGPGTWFNPDGNVADQVRKRQFPVIGNGHGFWNFVHIEDAANAVASAIYCNPGAYNIVNDHPARMSEWLPAFARFIGAPQPPFISEEEGFKLKGADSVYYATKLRPASNAKAKREFNFEPHTFEWLL